MEVNFKCTSDNLEIIPRSIIESTGLKFPEVHTNMSDISRLAKEFKVYKGDSICRVPFCVTVEAEAMGAEIKLGDDKNGPRVSSYIFNKIEELENIKEIDLSKGRIKEVLRAVENLSSESEITALNIEGPFTIISSIIDSMIFYRGIRKNREIIDRFMKVIEDNIVKYALEGMKRGARIISYGDPVGALDIVGPKIYKELSGKITYNVIKRLEPHLENSIIHLCGKTSTALESIGLCNVEPIEYDKSISYGEAICSLLENNRKVKIIGHNCIKRTPLKIKEAVIWKINLL